MVTWKQTIVYTSFGYFDVYCRIMFDSNLQGGLVDLAILGF